MACAAVATTLSARRENGELSGSDATLKWARPGVKTALHTFYRMISSFGAVSAGMPAAAAAALDGSNDAWTIATCPSRTSTG